MLVEALNYEDALRADLQQTYNIDLDHAMAGVHTPMHIGALIAYLPSNAHIRQRLDPDASWTRQETIMAALLNNLRNLIFGLTPKDKQGTPPKPLGPSWMTAEKMQKLPARVMSVDELMAVLEQPRRTNGRINR